MLRSVLRLLTWAVAVLTSALTVFYLPQVAIGFMLVPAVEVFDNPYARVVGGFALSAIFAWITFNYAEIAMIAFAIQVKRFLKYLGWRYGERLSELEKDTSLSEAGVPGS